MNKPLFYKSKIGYSFKNLKNEVFIHPFLNLLKGNFGQNGHYIWFLLMEHFVETNNLIPFDDKGKQKLRISLATADNPFEIIEFCIENGVYILNDNKLSISEDYIEIDNYRDDISKLNP